MIDGLRPRVRALAAWCTLAALLLCGEGTVAQRHVTANAAFDVGILRVERFGNPAARSIVFIPAMFCGAWQWNAQIDALSPTYDVLVVTLPGFDGRPAIEGEDLMQRAAQSLHVLLTTHRLNRPIVVGHSLGGTISIYYAERFPHDMTGVVTVEGGYPIAPTQTARDAYVAKSTAAYKGIDRSAVGAVIRKQTLQYTITSKADVDAVEPLAARSDPGAIIAWMRSALTLDLTPELQRIRVPLTVIIPFDSDIDPYQGFQSKAAKLAAYVRWVAKVPEPKVVLVTPSRHFVMFDQPVTFQQDLETALLR
ncbi:MAG: alpha/beta hydrolase [Candidatus Cybelea sp.]